MSPVAYHSVTDIATAIDDYMSTGHYIHAFEYLYNITGT